MPDEPHPLTHAKLKIRNYKCFGDEPTGFDEVKPLNLIVGRNNAGKSALVDVVAIAAGGYAPGVDPSRNPQRTPVFGDMGHDGAEPELLVTQAITEDVLSKVYRKDLNDEQLEWGSNVWDVAHSFVGKDAEWKLSNDTDDKNRFQLLSPQELIQRTSRGDYGFGLAKRLRERLKSPFFRLVSDRDIRPEDDEVPAFVDANGRGCTKLIKEFLHRDGYDRALVQEAMLNALNKVFRPDCRFSEITARQLTDDEWEVFLCEPRKRGVIRLSRSGSGLKTAILALAKLLLMPHANPLIASRPISRFVFGFEELENNLHPALQRRLFTYLREFAVENGCIMFLTTHSNVVIDLFADDESAQVLHVKHDGERAAVERVGSFRGRSWLLDDLGNRPSDLLQANGIVWVEGPSDRVYLKHWINLWSEGELKEGTHYRIMPCGGDDLAHFTGEDPDMNPDELISMVGFCPRVAFVCDKDKTEEGHPLRGHIEQIRKDVEAKEGIAWITGGREIENYVPVEALRDLWGKSEQELPPVERDELFNEYVKKHTGRGMGGHTTFARKVCRQITTKDSLASVPGLPGWLDKVVDAISKWNGLEPTKATEPGRLDGGDEKGG